MPRSLEDLDSARKGGRAAPLTVSEQMLRERAQGALDRLEKAKRSGDPVAIAEAKLAASRIQAELQGTNFARGSLEVMRSALAGAMTNVTVR
jgi:hypothetical protein